MISKENANVSKITSTLIMALGSIFCCALWGVSTPVVKMGYKYIDQNSIPSLMLWIGIQFLVAGVMTITFGCIKYKKIIIPKSKSSIKIIMIISLLQTILQYIFSYIGLSYTTAVKGAVLKSTDTLFVVLFICIVFKKEKLTVRKTVACLLSFIGIIIINLKGFQFDMNIGDIMVVGSIVFYALGIVLTKIYASKENPITLCGYQMLVGGGVLVIVGFLFRGTMNYIGMLPFVISLSAIYAVAYALWTVLIKKYSVSKISIFSFTVPVFSVIFSRMFLKEQDGISTIILIISLLFVSFGIILQSTSKT